jgi:hypothetical protein
MVLDTLTAADDRTAAPVLFFHASVKLSPKKAKKSPVSDPTNTSRPRPLTAGVAIAGPIKLLISLPVMRLYWTKLSLTHRYTY